MPQSRAKTIKHFASAVAGGDIDLTSVAPLDETIAKLETIPGIGPWTAHLVALRVMRHQDAFPASDSGTAAIGGSAAGKIKTDFGFGDR